MFIQYVYVEDEPLSVVDISQKYVTPNERLLCMDVAEMSLHSYTADVTADLQQMTLSLGLYLFNTLKSNHHTVLTP